MRLEDGDDPALGFCRICGTRAVPPFPGYYRDGVCSRECSDEFHWRDTLHIMRKGYHLPRVVEPLGSECPHCHRVGLIVGDVESGLGSCQWCAGHRDPE